MAVHKSTLSGWASDGRTWVWYEGSEEELEAMKVEAMARWPGTMECGSIEPLTGKTSGPRSRWICYRAFVFQQKSDAMLFKLSY